MLGIAILFLIMKSRTSIMLIWKSQAKRNQNAIS